MHDSVKILLAYHKPFELFLDDILTPIHVGRALAKSTEESDDFFQGMIGDDTGDNISEKNVNYNEMTAVYWAWKNYESLGNPEYVGLMHYRRHFFFNGERALRGTYPGYDEDYLARIGYTPSNARAVVRGYDIVCPKPMKRKSVLGHYEENHKALPLAPAIEILKEFYPEYAAACDEYLAGSDVYLYNMFIMRREVFFKYAQWMFCILGEYEARVPLGENRLYLTERLTGIFIHQLEKAGKKVSRMATMFIETPHTIPILMATDDNYVFPTIVAMISMLKNAHKLTTYAFYLMIPSVLNDENVRKIDRLCEIYPRCEIHYIDMGNHFEEAYLVGERITKPTYYRLLAAKILPNIDKCLYLDSDIIVCEDLTELYEQNVEDYYIAGVKAPSYHFPEDGNQHYLDKSGLDTVDQYVNAGVILLNLKRIRTDGITEKFMALIADEFPSQDQDIINVVCYDMIHFLPFKFNNMIAKTPNDFNKLKKLFSPEEVDTAHKKPTIVHYCDKVKPWNDLSCLYADIWWRYGKLYAMIDAEALEICAREAAANSTAVVDVKKVEALLKKKKDLQRKLDAVRSEKELLENSVSYRIGRAIFQSK